jgi:DUF177 domain-containing protein
MRIELEKLDGTNGQFAHVFETAELSLEDDRARLKGPAEVRGTIKREDGQVRIRGKVSAQVELECDRCLRPITVPVAADFNVDYVPASNYAADQFTELGDDDLSLSVFDGEAIDIDDLVREQVILALPSRALCREDCKGLCPVCGIDKNLKGCECESHPVDPRWAALNDFRF